MIKKNCLPLAIIAIVCLSLGSLTSCHDEDFGVSTPVLQERAFEHNFIKEFGQPSADQSWDFYAQKMESLRQGDGMTRATMAVPVSVDTTISQPSTTEFKNLVSDVAYWKRVSTIREPDRTTIRLPQPAPSRFML